MQANVAVMRELIHSVRAMIRHDRPSDGARFQALRRVGSPRMIRSARVVLRSSKHVDVRCVPMCPRLYETRDPRDASPGNEGTMSWNCGSRGCPSHSAPEHARNPWRLATITASVGEGADNRSADVRVIQGALNRIEGRWGGPPRKLATDGDCGPSTIAALRSLQSRAFANVGVDGRVDVGGRTHIALGHGGHRIEVALGTQTVRVFEEGRVVRDLDGVSGDHRHPTTPGHYWVWDKRHPYRSRTYDAQMDYALFFRADGKAFHQYHGPADFTLLRFARSITDEVGSHGCVRLSEYDARWLFGRTVRGTPVVVR